MVKTMWTNLWISVRMISDASSRTSNLMIEAIRKLSYHVLGSPELSQAPGESIRTLGSALLYVLTFILMPITR